MTPHTSKIARHTHPISPLRSFSPAKNPNMTSPPVSRGANDSQRSRKDRPCDAGPDVYVTIRCRVQEANSKAHKASKVLILGNMKMLLSTGTSRWNERQIILWDQVRPSRSRQGHFGST